VPTRGWTIGTRERFDVDRDAYHADERYNILPSPKTLLGSQLLRGGSSLSSTRSSASFSSMSSSISATGRKSGFREKVSEIRHCHNHKLAEKCECTKIKRKNKESLKKATVVSKKKKKASKKKPKAPSLDSLAAFPYSSNDDYDRNTPLVKSVFIENSMLRRPMSAQISRDAPLPLPGERKYVLNPNKLHPLYSSLDPWLVPLELEPQVEQHYNAAHSSASR
jgi:hypothetical protein